MLRQEISGAKFAWQAFRLRLRWKKSKANRRFGLHGQKAHYPSVEQLTRAELEALRPRLAAMPRHELKTFYKATHNARRYMLRFHRNG